jgi:Secretion system C-terminal sorting domain
MAIWYLKTNPSLSYSINMKRILTIALISLGFTARSQSISPAVLSAGGKTMTNGIVNVDWTLGEMATSTLSNANGKISQGFHQGLTVVQLTREAVSDQTTEMTESQKAADQQLDLKRGIDFKLFPNPTSDFVNITCTGHPELEMTWQLVDLKGQILTSGKLEGSEMQLDFTRFSIGSYLVLVRSQDGTFSKTYRVIKSN